MKPQKGEQISDKKYWQNYKGEWYEKRIDL